MIIMKAVMFPLLASLLGDTRCSTAFLNPIATRLNTASNFHPSRSRTAIDKFTRPCRLPLQSVSSLSEESARKTVNEVTSSSLASDYAIRVNAPMYTPHENELGSGVYTSNWEFHPLQKWGQSSDESEIPEIRALNDCAQSTSLESSSYKLICSWEGPYENQWYIEIDSKHTDNVPKELVCIISRIMVQTAASHISSLNDAYQSSLLHLTLPTRAGETFQEFQCSHIARDNGEGNDVGIRKLFTPLNNDYASSEIVDMVTHNGEILGSLPRPYVHSCNILHRGIGMIVSQNESILNRDNNIPNVYVHQRTDTKRIFPSLYDMFVGGVSCRGESAELTAAREVAEELGLRGALEYIQSPKESTFNPLSSELFRCTVCTSYNRCVVSMFTYQCLTDVERISWQEEEVQWGEFVPYDVVSVAAALSMDRMVEYNSWPGKAFGGDVLDSMHLNEKVDCLKKEYASDEKWETWDFVPDGLLVWEHWLCWFNRGQV